MSPTSSVGVRRRESRGAIHVVLPNDIDDPATPSGGNVYDRRICRGLADSGWSVHEHAVRGGWPWPGAAERADLARILSSLPDDAVVLLDGLVASAVPDVLTPQSRRLRLVVLVHMLLGDDAVEQRDREGAALASAATVITTSGWSRQRLLELYELPAGRIHVAPPGVDHANLAPGSGTGSSLLCVAAVTPHKGHDQLIRALAAVADRPWSCVCVGSLHRDPVFVERVRRQVRRDGVADRVRFAGPRVGDELDAAYAAADLLVLATRGETYGMVVTEALARGVPVLATAAKGLPEALGRAPDGSLPGMLVRPDDPTALAGALRRWLGDAGLRDRLGRSARDRRATLTDWAATSALIAMVLDDVPAVYGGVGGAGGTP